MIDCYGVSAAFLIGPYEEVAATHHHYAVIHIKRLACCKQSAGHVLRLQVCLSSRFISRRID